MNDEELQELRIALRVAEQKLRALGAAVNNYLEHPGCNIPARQTAQMRLRWAADVAAAPVLHQGGSGGVAYCGQPDAPPGLPGSPDVTCPRCLRLLHSH